MADVSQGAQPKLQLRRESTAEQVAGALRALIVTAALPAGTHLREGPLAEQLGVSRNTIREAIQVLVSQGLVTREIHRGAYVARLTTDDIRDMFRVRRLVELSAARHVTGAEDLGQLREACQALESAAESGDRTTIADADLRFHAVLVDTMNSERLGDLYRSVGAAMLRCIALIAPAAPEAVQLVEDQRAVLEALESGDGHRAAKVLEEHLNGSEELLVGSFEAAGDSSEEAAPLV